MKRKYEAVLKAANCWGCPFVITISGQEGMLCSKFAEGQSKIYPHVEDVEDCETRNAEIVHQLKEHQPKLGLGFIMTPLEGAEEGDCKVQLVGAEGVLFEGKLSELFPNETYVVLTTVRLFDERGVDRTDLIKKKALAQAYDNTPTSKQPFGALLDRNKP